MSATSATDEYWDMISCESPINLDEYLPRGHISALTEDTPCEEELLDQFASSPETDQYSLQATSTHSPPSETHLAPLICSVCGAPAHGYNFDQITCESCKAFFRRNALKKMTNLKCRYSGTCVINVQTRRQCTYCRLKKCFEVNMRKEWIRTDEERALRLLRNFQKEQRKLNNLPPDHELLQEIPIVVRKKKRNLHAVSKPLVPTQIVPKMEIDIHFSSFAIHRNLSPDDQILLNNINTAYRACAQRANCWRINGYTSSSTLSQFVNDETANHQSLIHFYKHIPDFRQFNLDDQILLIKCNLLNIIHLHIILVENFQENPRIGEHMSNWIGKDFHQQMSRTRCQFDRFMKCPHVLQITLIVFIFSMNLSVPRGSSASMNYRDRRKLYNSQNFYISLLWRYLRSLFDEREAIRAMTLIATQLLRYQLLMVTMEKAIAKTGQENVLDPLMRSILKLT